ncbi:prolyl 4-hydroxylase subunit alpha-2 [Nephila pilipes]|uniref:procollagen-proline 4-dioxygenase n=1 Tax=Nephila pilipes TaxID=299642 RepID=A0A8X6MTI9_NEPPI|nr:prolyl 4-hydroxylase subunit alpha-2 [Nephila pilipes]
MVDNPLQAFQLVRRLAVDWDFVKRAMKSDDWNPIRRLISDYRQLMPNHDDLQGAAMALVRLQDTYRLNMSDMARGSILGLPQGTKLSARDLLYLGKQSFTAGYYAHAISWLEEALARAHDEGNRTASVAEVRAFYTAAVDMHDKLFDRTDLDVKDYDTFGHPVRGNGSTAVLLGRTQVFRLGEELTPHEEQNNYMALCRGERLISAEEESKLLCRLDNRGHPYLLLRPLKIEERSRSPYVVLYHDLLTEAQTDLLKQIAEPKLARSMVQAGKGSEVVSVSRTSQNAWVGPHDHPLMTKVYRLVEFVTGLSTDVDSEHAEVVQIANYGMGGHYTPHHDYLLVDKDPEEMKYVHPKELDAGDRTATLMFYLSDVTRGGATVFPKVGASVWPRRGSAVFWYNLKQNGKENPQTLHGACPVAVGSKWVANFWIREKGQLFRRRCALDPEL